ncbi:DUF3742 family protein [Pseudomonas aeruginosa]|nr:DUF3742 family protein [Pseudomonas aeruginosa]MDF6002634.1 DUF3742 family protein [Pseudomonas aeruginosa]
MRTATHISTAERFGRWLGRGWRGYVRREGQAVAWLTARGVPGVLTQGVLWFVKLGALALSLYVGIWLTAICLGIAGAAWGRAIWRWTSLSLNGEWGTPGLASIKATCG